MVGLSWVKLKFSQARFVELELESEFTTSPVGWWLDYARLMLSQLQLKLELKFKLSLARMTEIVVTWLTAMPPLVPVQGGMKNSAPS